MGSVVDVGLKGVVGGNEKEKQGPAMEIRRRRRRRR
jgi:hypothetical protein